MTSEIVKTLPSDFDIFWFSTSRCSKCTQKRANGWPVAHSLCAISFSWCGKIRSMPPAWMSIGGPPSSRSAIAEHSMCQPGRPGPTPASQVGSPGLVAFHSTKSRASSFSYSSESTRAPLWMPA